MNLAVFPLPIMLLPGGITRLKIFEQRYLSMVKEASGDVGFILTQTLDDNPNKLSSWGTWVKIIDFQSNDGGILMIDIQGISVCTLSNVEVSSNNLRYCKATLMPHWQEQDHCSDTLKFADALQRLYNDHPKIADLYPQTNFKSASWTCGRWLEILPLSAAAKQQCFKQSSFETTKRLLSSIILPQKEIDICY